MIFIVFLDIRMANSDDEACTQQAANNLEAFRRIAQAHAERERFLPGAPVMMNNPLPQNLQNLTATASDYMRLAMPVRDPDNGDAISGSGKYYFLTLNYNPSCSIQPSSHLLHANLNEYSLL